MRFVSSYLEKELINEQVVLFLPHSLLGIIWKKSFILWNVFKNKTKQTCFCLTRNILSRAFSSKLFEFVSINQALQVYTKQYIKQKQKNLTI